MNRIFTSAVFFVLAFLITACTSDKPEVDNVDPVVVEEPPPPPPPAPTPLPENNVSTLDSDPQLKQRRVYFGFDGSNVEEDFRGMLTAHANYLQQNPNVTLTLEGHTDERGTREYNLALGERRARAVRQLLIVQGVSPNQIRFISYGEENPIATGHDEASWAQNRRVEVVYANQ